MKATLCLKLCVLAFALSSTVLYAGSVQVIDEDFEDPFTGFTTSTWVVGDATASFDVGDVGGSKGLIFGGTWNVVDSGEVTSAGALNPLYPPDLPYQIDPSNYDGFRRIDYTADVVLNGYAGDDVPNSFVQLLIFQKQDNGQIVAFTQISGLPSLVNTSWQNIQISATREDMSAFDGSKPDFGPNANPMSFGLLMGGSYTDNDFVGQNQGHLRLDNWTVTVIYPDLLMKDGFETPP